MRGLPENVYAGVVISMCKYNLLVKIPSKHCTMQQDESYKMRENGALYGF